MANPSCRAGQYLVFTIIILLDLTAANGEQAARFLMALPKKIFIKMLMSDIIQMMAI